RQRARATSPFERSLYRVVPRYCDMLCVFFFFFYSSLPTRDLHSFPTRRSSDLELTQPLTETEQAIAAIWAELLKVEHVPDGCDRSEEHTSELQSPYDLVCRLLLEKKKQKKKAQLQL